jgi:manganese-dependent inorganic pyrophosphatase
MIYVFGHKNPDTDSICAAIAYAYLKNKLGFEAKPFRLGEINNETKLVLSKFNVEVPELLSSVEGKDVILVDHNEFEQSADGIEKANIIEIIDHHKMKFSWDKPIYILTMPLGSTCTIIAKLFSQHSIEIPKELAGIMLSAILSDTVIFKSPTTTEEDKKIAEKLAEIAGISDITAWGVEMFKAKSEVASKSARELICGDCKLYDFNGKKVLIGQIEVVDDKEVLERKEELLEEMEKIKEEENLYGVVLMITDIMKAGSTLLVVAESLEPFEKAFNVKFEENSIWLPCVMSRKKQIVPPLENVFKHQ